jgi:hypothetical protein
MTLAGSSTSRVPSLTAILLPVRFQGTGVVGGEEWIYDYEAYMIRPWPNGIGQRMAMLGTIVRTIPHSSGGGTSPAGVVCSWIAVRQDDPAG